MTAAEMLNAAADLCERGWTQKASAINDQGDRVDPWDNEATAWCALGALCVAGGAERAEWEQALKSVVDVTGYLLTYWNDQPGRTQEEVVAALRAAAERAK